MLEAVLKVFTEGERREWLGFMAGCARWEDGGWLGKILEEVVLERECV